MVPRFNSDSFNEEESAIGPVGSGDVPQVYNDWSFSTTTETQQELPDLWQPVKAPESRLAFSSNVDSLSKSARPPSHGSDDSPSLTDVRPSAQIPARPTLSTIAQLPDSSYTSALSGTSQTLDLNAPTLADMDLPETQSFPSRGHLPNGCSMETQTSSSELTGPETTHKPERKRQAHFSAQESSDRILVCSNRVLQSSQDAPAVGEYIPKHIAKKARTAKTLKEGPLPSSAFEDQSQFSTSCLPSSNAVTSSDHRALNLSRSTERLDSQSSASAAVLPHGTQDMNIQVSSAPSVHLSPRMYGRSSSLGSGPEEWASEDTDPIGADKVVSQGRGLPVRRPWHGRAASTSSSLAHKDQGRSLASNFPVQNASQSRSSEKVPQMRHSPITHVQEPPPLTSSSAAENLDISTGSSELVCPMLFSPIFPPGITRPRLKPMQSSLSPPSAMVQSEDSVPHVTLDETTVPTEAAEPLFAIPSTNAKPATESRRLFVRDGGLYYPAAAKATCTDTIRIEFDDGSFSEITRPSLQRHAVAARLLPGDILVSSRQAKAGKQQRYRFLRTDGNPPPDSLLQKTDVVIVELESPACPKESPSDEQGPREWRWHASEVALVAGPHVHQVSRALQIDELFLASKPTAKSKATGIPQALQSNLFQGVGLVFTAVESGNTGPSLQQVAAANGAAVVDDLESIVDAALAMTTSMDRTKGDHRHTDAFLHLEGIYLISQEPVTTPKYLLALALGLPCVSSAWIRESLQEHQQLDWKTYACTYACKSLGGQRLNTCLSSRRRCSLPDGLFDPGYTSQSPHANFFRFATRSGTTPSARSFRRLGNAVSTQR